MKRDSSQKISKCTHPASEVAKLGNDKYDRPIRYCRACQVFGRVKDGKIYWDAPRSLK